MDTVDIMPQPQGRPPRSRLTWVWPIITHALLVGNIGFWIWGFMVPFHEPHLQIIGSGWWQYGTMAVAWLLYALMGFSVKVSALTTRRVPRVLWIPATKLLEFNVEAGGFAFFLGYGLLPLAIHPSNPVWIAGSLMLSSIALGIGALITKIKPIRRRLTAALGSNGSNGLSLVSQPVYLSRRAFLSGGVALGMGAAGLVAFWRALPALIPDYTFFEQSGYITSLSWFPDGRRMVSGDGSGKVLIWNADDGSDRRTLAHNGRRQNVLHVSPNGALIATGNYDILYIWDAVTGVLSWKRDTGFGERSFSWAPDSSRMVVLRGSQDVGVVDVVARTDVKVVFTLPEYFYPDVVAWSPDGRFIAAADRSRVIIWDASSGTQQGIRTLPLTKNYLTYDLAWSPDGRSLVVALERVVYVWSRDNAAPPIVYREFSGDSFSISLSWSPDGRYIASCGSFDKTVRVWEAATGKTVFVYNGHFSSVEAVAWSPDGRRIASGGWDNLVHVWRPALPA